MSTISWNPSEPEGASDASTGDNAIRSLMTNFATGVGEFLYFPSSAASQGASTSSTGEPQLGTMRAARLASVLGNVGNGFLGFETTKGGLWHLGSGWTGVVGHPGMQVGVGGITAPFITRWVRQEGSFPVIDEAAPLAGSAINLFGITYGAPPIVLVTARPHTSVTPSRPQDAFFGAHSTTTNFTSRYSNFSSTATSVIATVYWESLGTVSY